MKPIVLTDVEKNIWLDTFEKQFGSVNVRKRTLHGGLSAGVDIIDVSTGDLSFSILPTRGMSLWRGKFKDFDLGWQAPVRGPVHPKFVNQADRSGLGWLTGFDEWLCRCGLNWNGPPGDDNGRPLTLHGRIANSPAHFVEVDVNDQRIQITGEVEEAGLFHARLELRTVYTVEVGSNRLRISDTVTNRGGTPAEMQLLYHCNFGPPLLGAGSKVHVPVAQLWPMTEIAAQGLSRWNTYEPPSPGFNEQVYCITPICDEAKSSLAVLHDADRKCGVAIRYPVESLPCFTVWKNTGAIEDGYVTGLEPATNFPQFRALERQAGRIRTLESGQSWTADWSMEFSGQSDEINEWVSEVVKLQSTCPAIVRREPLAK